MVGGGRVATLFVRGYAQLGQIHLGGEGVDPLIEFVELEANLEVVGDVLVVQFAMRGAIQSGCL